MTDVTERSSIDESLHLALDLCLALGAFVVTLTGCVHSVVSPVMPPDDGGRRMELLARSCLTHPAAHGREMFWTAEMSTEVDSLDRSLACVVVPMWTGATQVGLLGIADTWLPEPDEDQRDGLRSLAERLASFAPQFLVRRAHVESDEAPVAESSAPPPVNGGAFNLGGELSLLRAVLDGLPDAAVVTRRDGAVLAANDAFASLCGLDRDELVGSDLGALMTDDSQDSQDSQDSHDTGDADDSHDADDTHDVDGAVATVGDEPFGRRRVVRKATGDAVVVRASERRVADERGDEWIVVVARPAALAPSAAALRQRLGHVALYDPLTGLASRLLFVEELRRMLQGLSRRGGTVALIHLVLDDFEHVVDRHGREMGEEVLGAVGRRLRGAVRADDVACRLGGSEFVIAHASAEADPDDDSVVSRLRKAMAAPFRVRGHTLDVGVSIGYVSTDKGGVDPEALLARADRETSRREPHPSVTRLLAP